MNYKKVSVVIPCYNEKGNVRELYSRLKKVIAGAGYAYEIIFVDNKSIDGTRDILLSLATEDKNVMLLFFSRNFGHSQYGFTAGTDYATGDAVVWMDSDLQDPPEVIQSFIKKWEEGYRVIYGVRKKRRGSLFLGICYKVFYRVFKKFSYLDIPLDAGDFSLIDRTVVEAVKSMPERDRYVRGLRTWAGFKSIGVPYTREDRYAGKTSNSLKKNIWWAKKAIFSFSYAPLELVFYFSLIVFILTVIAIFVYLISYFFAPGPRGFTTLLLVTLFLGSSQLLALSAIAEYVGRIFEEVKGRPRYIIEEEVNTKHGV